jgi:O-antigen/teichoic acid export membrane protein
VSEGPPSVADPPVEDRRQGPEESIPRNTAYALAIQLTTAAFTAGLTLYLARALGPDEFGIFALALSVGTVLLLPSDFGVSQSVSRFIAERRGDDGAVSRLMSDALKLKALFAGVTCVAMIASADLVADAYDEPALAWALRGMALAVLGQSVMQLYGGAFSGLARTSSSYRMVFSKSLVETAASIGLVVAGAGAAGAAFGRAVGYGVGAVIGALTMARFLAKGRRRSGSGAERVDLRRIAGYATAILIIDAAFTLFTQIDVLVIGAVMSAAAAGLFQAPLRLVAFLHYPGYSLAGGVAPRMAESQEGRRVDAFRNAMRFLVIFQSLLMAPVLVWADPLIRLLLGAPYAQSAGVLRALAPYVFLQGMAPLVSMSVNFMGEARLRVPIAIATVLVNFGIDIVLIPKIGILGGAIGTNVAYFIYVPAHLWICRRMVGLRLRPLLITLVRSLVGAAAMSGVLALFGTSSVSVPMLALGSVAGGVVFLLTLLATREISPGELRAAGAQVRRRLPLLST